jgi:hypothetical protein
MKTKLFLLTVLFASVLVACNQLKQKTEKVPETKTEEMQKVEEAKPTVAKGILLNTENDEPISMAMVIVAGTQVGSMTSPDGKFQIKAPAGAKQLFFSAEGFEALKVDIDGENEMTVKLKPKAE